MADQPERTEATGSIGTRSVEVAVALVLLALGLLVIYDSQRLGAGWSSDGPEAGYFPFYIGLLLCIASGINLVQALTRHAFSGSLFVTWGPLKLVLTVLIPAIVYVLAVQYIGIYIASAVYITVFMIWLGHYSVLRSALVGFGVMVAFFLMFEVWFKVPLYKGSLDPLAFLGY
jgi:hypothetical protein